MKYKESHYRGKTVEGFRWSGYWDNFHHFSRRVIVDGYPKYEEIRCTDTCIENGNLEFMAKHNLTL